MKRFLTNIVILWAVVLLPTGVWGQEGKTPNKSGGTAQTTETSKKDSLTTKLDAVQIAAVRWDARVANQKGKASKVKLQLDTSAVYFGTNEKMPWRLINEVYHKKGLVYVIGRSKDDDIENYQRLAIKLVDAKASENRQFAKLMNEYAAEVKKPK
ncbi:hypothetical protein H8B06_13835 [Sphingobacterium sp. DN00404]|uniref:Uncharacterized protein n=1 Tax=Sphingobacterium micropteri TaxID=2763501 RepID=A0ABR7YRE7_9SPHI|nr:hypothetical protein [Sphingobacterium micropteri]MBD1433914.1 hypothetical protein [Sphingobacterium micropteri]